MKVAQTVFAGEEFQKSAKLDDDIEKELLDIFSSKPVTKKVDVEEQKQDDDASSSKGPKTAGILDQKRIMNTLIMLTKIPHSPEEICAAVQTLDPLAETLSDDNVVSIVANAFKDEELEMAKNYTAPREDVALLNGAEQFAYYVARVPRFGKKMKAMYTMRTAAALESEVRASISVVLDASREVRRSKKFEVVLATVLGIGNFLNAGTAKGQARGFKLETLPKLCDTKTRGGDRTLLHYVVEVVGKKAPGAISFVDEIRSVQLAKRIMKEDVAKELTTFQRAVAVLGSEVTEMIREAESAGIQVPEVPRLSKLPPPVSSPSSSRNLEELAPGVGFDVKDGNEPLAADDTVGKESNPKPETPLDAARIAFQSAEKAANDLQGLQEEMLREFSEAATYLGEDVRHAKTDEVFSKLSMFVSSFEDCLSDNKKRKEEAERKERLEKRRIEDEAQRKARRESKKAAGQDGGDEIEAKQGGQEEKTEGAKGGMEEKAVAPGGAQPLEVEQSPAGSTMTDASRSSGEGIGAKASPRKVPPAAPVLPEDLSSPDADADGRRDSGSSDVSVEENVDIGDDGHKTVDGERPSRIRDPVMGIES